MLRVEHLNVWYGPTEVLRDVSFAVPENGLVALLGGNGSGKTTVLNTLSGLVRPRKGTVHFAGQEVTGLGPEQVVRHGVVQVPQGREVFSDMTVQENLELGAATRHDAAGIRRDIDSMLTTFPSLRARRTQRAGLLSGGEQTQLAIARALMVRPRLLMLDEPSVGLSPVVIETLIDSIRVLHRQGLTVLLVEQNVGVAAEVADHAYVLKDGMVAYSGSAADLTSNEQVLHSYLGR
jgi:branched-chain amino acid transport system ATP-binding protein